MKAAYGVSFRCYAFSYVLVIVHLYKNYLIPPSKHSFTMVKATEFISSLFDDITVYIYTKTWHGSKADSGKYSWLNAQC